MRVALQRGAMVDFAREQQTIAWLERAQTVALVPRVAPAKHARMVQLEAAYDSASLNEFTSAYWRRSDGLSPDEAIGQAQGIVRQRARFEAIENDSVINGMVNQVANDLIGSGPRPQLSFPEGRTGIGREKAQKLERSWKKWADEIQLARKLRTGRIAKATDGEAFFRKVTNRNLRHAVKLDVIGIEADQIATPYLNPSDPQVMDGMRWDRYGNVETFFQLRHHPGSAFGNGLDAEPVPARYMFHLFRQQRPGQHRGISELAPALPEAALLRDFKIAVLHAARTAAKHAAVMETNATDITDDILAFSSIPLEIDSLTALPNGWRLSQLRAEQPTTTYVEFYNSVVNTIARCLLMPFNMALGNSSSYNYASGRLDFQSYDLAIREERAYWERSMLTPLFEDFLYEAVREGILDEDLDLESIEVSWMWDSRGHVDPLKEAKATETELRTGVSHRRREYAEVGLDLDVEDEVAARDMGFKNVEEYRSWLRDNLAGSSGKREDSADLALLQDEPAAGGQSRQRPSPSLQKEGAAA